MAVSIKDLQATTSGQGRRVDISASAAQRMPAVKVWAGIGAAFVALWAYVLVTWVTSDYFKAVPKGVSDVPGWMATELIGWQVISIPIALLLLERFVIRTWRRERHIGIDGLLVLAFATLWPQDLLSNFNGGYFVYNSSMLNFGSWANAVPGWMSFGRPGAMTSEPILFTPAAYVYCCLAGTFFGAWAMRRTKRRFPDVGTLGLLGGCFSALVVFDIVIEGVLWMPLGIYEYPGGHWALFGDTYHKYPVNETITLAAAFTGLSSLKYFLDDRGRSIAERGIDQVRGPMSGYKVALRAFAVIGAVQILFLVFYNIPNVIIGMKADTWPKDLQERSYFTNGLCGAGTDRLCPVNGKINLPRQDAPYVNSNRGVTVPEGFSFPTIAPFGRGATGGGS